MATNTNNLHQFLITRDGYIDWDAHEALERAEKTEMLHSAVTQAIERTVASTLAVGRIVGKGLITWLESIE